MISTSVSLLFNTQASSAAAYRIETLFSTQPVRATPKNTTPYSGRLRDSIDTLVPLGKPSASSACASWLARAWSAR